MMRLKTTKQDAKDCLLAKRRIAPSPDGRFQDCWWFIENCKEHNKGPRISFNKELVLINRLSAWAYELKDPEGNLFTLDSKYQALHKCDNPKCHYYEHLFIGTEQDNHNDAVDKGRHTRLQGSKHHQAKLDENDIVEMRKLWDGGGFTKVEIGEIFNISRQVAGAIVERKSWQHVEG